jgi:hypothetical protein
MDKKYFKNLGISKKLVLSTADCGAHQTKNTTTIFGNQNTKIGVGFPFCLQKTFTRIFDDRNYHEKA